jgi:hypothetical protein
MYELNPFAGLYMRNTITMEDLIECQRAYPNATGDMLVALDKMFDKIDMGKILVENV